MISPAAVSDPKYWNNGSKYFTHDDEMIARGSILSGTAMLGTDPEDISPFTDYFITDRAFVWDKMVEIFQGLDACTYLKTDKKYRDGRLGFRFIYNHYLGTSNIYHMAAGAEKNITQCTYTGEEGNWTFEKYATLHKEEHNIPERLN